MLSRQVTDSQFKAAIRLWENTDSLKSSRTSKRKKRKCHVKNMKCWCFTVGLKFFHIETPGKLNKMSRASWYASQRERHSGTHRQEVIGVTASSVSGSYHDYREMCTLQWLFSSMIPSVVMTFACSCPPGLFCTREVSLCTREVSPKERQKIWKTETDLWWRA